MLACHYCRWPNNGFCPSLDLLTLAFILNVAFCAECKTNLSTAFFSGSALIFDTCSGQVKKTVAKGWQLEHNHHSVYQSEGKTCTKLIIEFTLTWTAMSYTTGFACNKADWSCIRAGQRCVNHKYNQNKGILIVIIIKGAFIYHQCFGVLSILHHRHNDQVIEEREQNHTECS